MTSYFIVEISDVILEISDVIVEISDVIVEISDDTPGLTSGTIQYHHTWPGIPARRGPEHR